MNRELLQLYQEIIEPWGAGFNLTITPFFFQGLATGSEYAAYNANKLYLCGRLLGSNVASVLTTGAQLLLHNAADVGVLRVQSHSVMYDSVAAAARYSPQTIEINNAYFSRVTFSVISEVIITGYRIDRA